MPEQAAKPVVFLHIPKTAGSTLYRILESHYRWENIYTLWQTGTLDEFKQLSPAEFAKIELLRGHFSYGLAKNLPETAVFFTILREPIDRVISYYHFIRRTPHHYCHQRVTEQNLSLEQFITSQIDTLVDNGQTRLLANLAHGHEVPFGQLTAAHLAQAKQNLQKMQVVGLMERFDETLFLLRAAFGWQKIRYARQNVTSNRRTAAELPPATQAALQATNQLDVKLYQFAQTLFAEQLAQLGDDFPHQLAEFQVENGRFQPLTQLFWNLRKYPVRTYFRQLLEKVRP